MVATVVLTVVMPRDSDYINLNNTSLATFQQPYKLKVSRVHPFAFTMMFEAFGFSADSSHTAEIYLSYLRAMPLWWLSSLCLNFLFSLGHSSPIADLLSPGF